ncbi:flocculation protein FLO11 isoform X1 [Kryptolebias marmoratus]|uniref:Flocculation protein FLO11-like n=1 Tax=Kryptolebias marmoratus TaxID=37003 RepID=A0A3Q3AIS3_KRYMA|nr:flocculation protein FLO11 isoform X1 [Kryptolebias marmoratus]XP_017263310.1 flocculation protein FLO11 isoform X1 [Kryptolebias marmoratus]XP_037835551.1 flocculation protein FLO11 isoform X1 [Kryptolebias marmoratus]
MVSKEPNHLLTGQSNSKSTLADKLPGTMTVRSVLLNRDSPDIESRLKRRRNRTHQVRFKDLEDGSSSSGNSAIGENNGHQRPATNCNSPHPLRKHSSMSPNPWTNRLQTESLLGQTSVVGAVREDMASTIEKVAAFLARAPPHPLTPGATRRCWASPQANSLTLPMTRRPSTSTSTAIQTSPCLKKPQSLSSTHKSSHSIGDSVGVDGDDEHDSQDEYTTHNHVLMPGSKGQSRALALGDKTVVERRSKASRTDNKSAVTAKTLRHSCPPSVLHSTEPCHCSSVTCRDGTKRQGSSTPSVVRRRKRLNRTASDPGKEVHYCTTPTQTESPSRSPPPLNINLCTTQVQTESPSPPPNSKYCTTQSQTEHQHQSPSLSDEHCTTQIQTTSSGPTLPPDVEQCSTQIQTDSPSHISPIHEPCTTQMQTCSSVASPPLSESPSSAQIQSDNPVSPPVTPNTPTTKITTVPYCTSPPPTRAPGQTPEDCTKPPCSSPSKPACATPPPPSALSISSSTSTPTAAQNSIPYYTVVSPLTIPSTAVACSSLSSNAPQCLSRTCTSPIPNPISSSSLTCSTLTPTISPILTPCDPSKLSTSVPNITQQPPTNNVPLTNLTPCTFVTQTALSCTSISYYTTTHPVGLHPPHLNPTPPSYATLIQTVSHCNIPCQALQHAASVGTGITSYPSPMPNVNSCTSPPPVVKAYVSTLQNAQSCATPTKAVPLYSSTFRAAPPYTPPSQAPHNAQDKRGIRLPPPPPPPPPYTPRKSEPPGPAARTPMLRAENKASEKDKEKENEKKEDIKCTDSPKLCEKASSLKHRAQTPPVAVMKGERHSSTSSPAKACFKPSCLSSAQAQLGVLHKMLCSGANARPNTPNSQHMLPPNQQGCSGARGCSVSGEQPTTRPLTPTQADTIRQVQEILGGLMSRARCKLDPSRVTEKLLSPNGPLHDIRSLQNQLQSLEGVLETSQNTIKVLLDVIQDLEKKEAERDGRHSYRTGQDIENCGTCRDCACIIYSVEHDFRLQEGQVVRTWKVGDPPEGPPQTPTPQAATPHQQDSPQLVRPPATAKKNRKKCFWFL